MQRGYDATGEHLTGKLVVEPGTDSDQREGSDRLQCRHGEERETGNQHQHDQRISVAAGNDAVEDLKHVQRRGQHQKIDAHAKNSNHRKSLAAG